MLKTIKIPVILILWPMVWYVALRWTMYKYWALDIIDYRSWLEVMVTWNSGKILPWSFVLTATFALPALLVGFLFLFRADLTLFLRKALKAPVIWAKRRSLRNLAHNPVKIRKKKSYMQIRPPALKPVSTESYTNPRQRLAEIEATQKEKEYDRYLDQPIPGKPPKDDFKTPDLSKIKALNRTTHEMKFDGLEESAAPAQDADTATIAEILENAGYRVLTGLEVGGKPVTAVAVSDKAVILCFEEGQAGEWLADEERFNDDEPLWFSESAQKVSPAFRAIQARNKVNEAVTKKLPDIAVVPVLVVSNGNIINASDMLDVWENLQVFVGRIGKGGPAELKKLSSLIPANQDDSVSNDVVNKVKSAIESVK